VEGVLWLGARTGRLRSVEYQYVNLPWRVDASSAGGDVHFRGLPNGTWVVTDWRIRVPRLTEDRSSNGLSVLGHRVLGYREEGGAVDVVATTVGEVVDRSADRGSVSGVVTDSLGRPAGDARAWIAGTDYEVTTAADGIFGFTGVGPGTWSVGATHPGLQSVGHRGSFQDVVVEQGGVGSVRLNLPSRYGAALELCSEDAPAVGTILGGRVLNAESRPAAGAAVRVIWAAAGAALDVLGMPIERSTTWEGLGSEADGDGTFRVCGLPDSGTLWVSAEDGEASSALIEVTARANSLASVDLRLSPVVARQPEGIAALSGAEGAWLSSKGFELRAGDALLHQSAGQINLALLTNLERILRQIPRVEVVRRADGRNEYRLHAATDWATRADSTPPCLLEFFLNGSMVRGNVPTSMIDYSDPRLTAQTDLRPLELDRWLEASLVTGIEVFDGENAPVLIPGGCGAALIWAYRLEDEQDPEFRGRLSGRVVRVPEGVPVVGVIVRLEPGGVELQTDAFGRFEYGRLPPARYRIEATVPAWGKWTTEVMLRSGSLADVRIEVEGAPVVPAAPPRVPMPGP
jgi:hypothetical protein